ncbi:protein BCAP-like [Musca vetustissima]|uniref:protein BCAP-like n=1 Tax=Musca vetustissima TaxID=27455 RepID=UPI002AB6680C|nr:protein BCAP-like [Musca vetustissima]
MLTKEDVEGWNKVFADCQIKQSDLTQPTEGFLIRALVCYIRRFGYKVEPPFPLNKSDTVENNRENRLFLIRLARQIDHFLKITDKSYSFTYYELIRPTPKKTSHTLYILLNYLFYYNMYKEEVFKMAQEPIQKYHELKAQIERQQRENELKAQQSNELKMTVDELTKKLPQLRTEHRELAKRKASQDESLQKLKESCEELSERLKHLHEQKRSLQKKVVADEESRELQKHIDNIKADIARHKEMANTSENSLRELSNSVELMQRLKKEIENARDIVPLRLIDQLKETNKQLEKAMADERTAQERRSILTQNIEDEQQKYETLEHQYVTKKQQFEVKEKAHKESLQTLHEVLKEKTDHLAKLEKEEHALDGQIDEQKDIAEYLEETISEILTTYVISEYQ